MINDKNLPQKTNNQIIENFVELFINLQSKYYSSVNTFINSKKVLCFQDYLDLSSAFQVMIFTFVSKFNSEQTSDAFNKFLAHHSQKINVEQIFNKYGNSEFQDERTKISFFIEIDFLKYIKWKYTKKIEM